MLEMMLLLLLLLLRGKMSMKRIGLHLLMMQKLLLLLLMRWMFLMLLLLLKWLLPLLLVLLWLLLLMLLFLQRLQLCFQLLRPGRLQQSDVGSGGPDFAVVDELDLVRDWRLADRRDRTFEEERLFLR